MSEDIDWSNVADTACPECRAGKHQNCDGTALDRASDGVRICPCDDDNHPEVKTWGQP